MVRHCGWLLTRFQMKSTGRTAYCSRMGREYRREIVEFAEQVLFHISESSGPGATVGKLMTRWDLGVWVGKINDSDEHVLLTPFGSKRARSIRRLPQTSKWNSDFLKTVRGLPWNPMETEVEKVTTVDIGKARRLYITRAMVVESGETPGCLGCTGIHKFHDENCRKRFERIYLHTAAMPTTAAPIFLSQRHQQVQMLQTKKQSPQSQAAPQRKGSPRATTRLVKPSVQQWRCQPRMLR